MSINEIMELTALLKEQAREDIRKENEYMIEHGETNDPQLSFFDDEEEFDDDKTEKANEPKEGYLRVHTWFGDYDVIIYRSTYYGTENLAIQLFTEEEPFATLTVNLGGFLEPNEAYVDTNNCPWAEDFIKENQLGTFKGFYKNSGYCMYPLYEFDLSKL